MNKKQVFLIIFLSLLIPPVLGTNGWTDVTVSEAKAMIDSDPSLLVLDVRAQSEYYDGHIRNAKPIPHTELAERLIELNTTDKILVYCGSGYRSEIASDILVANGFLYVYNMLGGITAWIIEGYPVYVKYSSIQEAVNDASEGDAILVSSGLYNEHVTVNKSIALFGENRNTTIVDGAGNGTIFHVKANNVSISNFMIQYCGCACAGYSGIHIEGHHQNVNITNNNIVFNGFGIRLELAKQVLIAYNNITSNSDWSIVISNSSNIELLGNSIKNTLYGIKFENVTDTIVSNNTIFNSVYGIFLSYSSNDTFIGNTVSSNSLGGIYISQSHNNFIFHNNFVENHRQTINHDSVNIWNSSVEGNYWSNYSGCDSNFDGIGDLPHTIDTNNTDNFPLMGMFSSFETSLEYNVRVISNSTIEDFEYFESNGTIRMYVSNMTINQTFGFVRIRIPHALMNKTYDVAVDGAEPYYVNYTLYDDGENRWIYFSYQHSMLEIVIVPEINTFTIWLLALLSLSALIFRKCMKHFHKPPKAT